jgi:hypothetical protein
MDLKFNLIRSEEGGGASLTVYYGGRTYVANEEHPCWPLLVEKTLAGDTSVVDLFDIGQAVGKRLALSDRVAYAKGYLFLDGDRISDGLANHIVRMVQEGEEDVQPFVLLLENILQNPSANSRDQLYRYIDKHNITITPDGQLVLYKYVFRNEPNNADTPAYRSGNSGPALINGEPHKDGWVPQDLGDVIAMPRSDVQDNPGVACASGLHVGAWSYVGSSGDVRLEIRVHPRDVVSVPRDENERKVRVCRYKIIREVTLPYDEAVLHDEEPEPTLFVPIAEPVPDDGYEEYDVDYDEYEEDVLDPTDAGGTSASDEEDSEDPTVATSSASDPSGGGLGSTPGSGTGDAAPLGASDASGGAGSTTRQPTKAEWNTMRMRAKGRRQNFVKYAERVGKWTQRPDTEGDKREDWTV